jgi:hypothetical protein
VLEIVPETCWSHAGIGPKACRHRAAIVPKSCRSRARIAPKSFRNRADIMPNTCRDRVRIVPKLYRKFPGIVPELCRNCYGKPCRNHAGKRNRVENMPKRVRTCFRIMTHTHTSRKKCRHRIKVVSESC